MSLLVKNMAQTWGIKQTSSSKWKHKKSSEHKPCDIDIRYITAYSEKVFPMPNDSKLFLDSGLLHQHFQSKHFKIS